jgi:hypothetical protein
MQTALQGTVAVALHGLAAPVFFAAFDPGRSRLTLHVHAGCNVAAIKAHVSSAMEKAREPIEVTVTAHSLRQLAFPRSLEQWLSRFAGGHALYDPTMIVSHAQRLLAAAKSCRTALGRAIRGSFFDPERRTLLLLAREGADGRVPPALQSRVAAIANEACQGASAAGKSLPAAANINVQVVAELPRRRLVPVEATSAWLPRNMASTVRRWLAPAAVVLAMSGAPAAASVDPGQYGSPATSASTRASADFGILPGLTAFAEASRHDIFAAMTLEWFFGGAGSQAADGSSIQIAQSKKKLDACFDIKGKPTGADCVPFYTGS